VSLRSHAAHASDRADNEVRTHVSLGRARPAQVRSSAWEILSPIRSWAGYTIDTRES